MQMYMMYLYVPEMKLMDQGLEPEHDEHTHTHTHTHNRSYYHATFASANNNSLLALGQS